MPIPEEHNEILNKMKAEGKVHSGGHSISNNLDMLLVAAKEKSLTACAGWRWRYKDRADTVCKGAGL